MIMKENGMTLNDIRSELIFNELSENTPVSVSSKTVDTSDFFNTTFLKGYLSNNTVLKSCSSVSNNTVLS